jgi:hypothetical protein
MKPIRVLDSAAEEADAASNALSFGDSLTTS